MDMASPEQTQAWLFGPPPLPCYDGRGFQSVHPRHGDTATRPHGDTATRRALDFSRRATMAGDQDEVCWCDISGFPMGTVEEILHQLLITSDTSNYEKL